MISLSFLTFCFSSGAGIVVSSLWLGPGALDWGEAAFHSSLLLSFLLCQSPSFSPLDLAYFLSLLVYSITIVLDGLETNTFTVVEVVEGLVVVAITGFDMVGGVAVVVVVTVVLGAEVADALDNKKGFSIIVTLYCLLPT